LSELKLRNKQVPRDKCVRDFECVVSHKLLLLLRKSVAACLSSYIAHVMQHVQRLFSLVLH